VSARGAVGVGDRYVDVIGLSSAALMANAIAAREIRRVGLRDHMLGDGAQRAMLEAGSDEAVHRVDY
jgi:hypothetical protein